MDLNYLKSDEGKGIIVDRAGSKGTTASSYVDSETALPGAVNPDSVN